MLEPLKRSLPPPLRKELGKLKRQMGAMCRRVAFGEIGCGYESTVLKINDSLVRKQYGHMYRESQASYHRPDEGKLLFEHPSPLFVKVLSYDEQGYTMERLDHALGDEFGISRVRQPRALFTFLDEVLEELDRHNLRHHDIHPGNILFRRSDETYLLTDFAWARHKDETYDLPPINPTYGIDDAVAVAHLREDTEARLRRPHRVSMFLDKLHLRPLKHHT